MRMLLRALALSIAIIALSILTLALTPFMVIVLLVTELYDLTSKENVDEQ